MCQLCATPLRYCSVYESAYRSTDKNEWLSSFISRASNACLSYQCRAMRFLSVALETQSIFEKIEPAAKKMAFASIQRVRKIQSIRTRRLVKRMLHHTYRPGGRMYLSTLRCLRPFVGDDKSL